jgi:hypothetical protein
MLKEHTDIALPPVRNPDFFPVYRREYAFFSNVSDSGAGILPEELLMKLQNLLESRRKLQLKNQQNLLVPLALATVITPPAAAAADPGDTFLKNVQLCRRRFRTAPSLPEN